MNVKLFIDTLAKYGTIISEEQAKDYEKLLRGESLPAKKESKLKAGLAGLIEQMMQKDPKFAKRMKHITRKLDVSDLPEVNIVYNNPYQLYPMSKHYSTLQKILSNFNDRDLVIASLGDIYEYSKILSQWVNCDEAKKISEAYEKIRRFNVSKRMPGGVITSTKILYTPNTAKIIHYSGIKNKDPLVKEVALPMSLGTDKDKYGEIRFLTEVYKPGEGGKLTPFLQALFNTEDSPGAILTNLSLLFAAEKHESIISSPLNKNEPSEADVTICQDNRYDSIICCHLANQSGVPYVLREKKQ